MSRGEVSGDPTLATGVFGTLSEDIRAPYQISHGSFSGNIQSEHAATKRKDAACSRAFVLAQLEVQLNVVTFNIARCNRQFAFKAEALTAAAVGVLTLGRALRMLCAYRHWKVGLRSHGRLVDRMVRQVARVITGGARSSRVLQPTLLPPSVASEVFDSAASIESRYQRKTPLEHVLLRPGMYIGSTARLEATPAWLPPDATTLAAYPGVRMTRVDATRPVPGLVKLFDEILVNAMDNRVRDPTTSRIDVVIDPGSSTAPPKISVRNDGAGIPVALHRSEGVYVPELVFGHLLSGSNFDDGVGGSSSSVNGATRQITGTSTGLTGGRHGYGAKLTNIFSTSFSVETVDTRAGLRYEQTWRRNMTQREEPCISAHDSIASGGGGYTRITFEPDTARFAHQDETSPARATLDAGAGDALVLPLDTDTVEAMRRRVWDAAGTVGEGVTVTLDGVTLPVNGFLSYCRLFTPPQLDNDCRLASSADAQEIAMAIQVSHVPVRPGKAGGTTPARSRASTKRKVAASESVDVLLSAATVASPNDAPTVGVDGDDGGVAWATSGGPLTAPQASVRLSRLAYARLPNGWEIVVGAAGLPIRDSVSDSGAGGAMGAADTVLSESNSANRSAGDTSRSIPEQAVLNTESAAAGHLTAIHASGLKLSPVPTQTAAMLAPYNEPGVVASFVNNMSTPRGGNHVSVVLDALCRRLAPLIAKRCGANSDLPPVTPAAVRPHLRLFLSASVPHPVFDSQSKEALMTPGSTLIAAAASSSPAVTVSVTSSPSAVPPPSQFPLPDRFIRAVLEDAGVADAVIASLRARAAGDAARAIRRGERAPESRVKSTPKLEDANWAGTRRAAECTLILTEGDSAKALAMAGIAVVGRDTYGVFPLRGKLLNVRELTPQAALANAEVAAIVQILGLQFGRVYAPAPAPFPLRYGRVLIMADQDVDGSHIKGLLINLFHTFWPSLLEANGEKGGMATGFLQAFLTPLIKARGRNNSAPPLEFFSVAEFEAWHASPAAARNGPWRIKYYKGLGTSTSTEGRAYFRDLPRYVQPFLWGGPEDGAMLSMAFSKTAAAARRAWLSADSAVERNQRIDEKTTSATSDYDVTTAHSVSKAHRAGDASLSEIVNSAHDGENRLLSIQTRSAMTFHKFVDAELRAFSVADTVRSIPALLDGLKPSQRKVLFACFRRAGSSSTQVRSRQRSSAADEDDANAEDSAGTAVPVVVEQEFSTTTQGSLQSSSFSKQAAQRLVTAAAAAVGPEVKVAQLAGYIAEHTAYHHGEAALTATVVRMAQDFVGSNNVPLLAPLGQFGTRLSGGKDAASARYIFTRLSPLARLIFPAGDDALLARREDDGAPVEPVSYVPTVPVILLNGAEGIGTGWATSVPCYCPLAVIRAVEAAVDRVRAGDELADVVATLRSRGDALVPWSRGFTGAIVRAPTAGGDGSAANSPPSFVSYGRASFVAAPMRGGGAAVLSKRIVSTASAASRARRGNSAAVASAPLRSNRFANGDTDGDESDSDNDVAGDGSLSDNNARTVPSWVRITELPLGRWTEDYKAFLRGLVDAGTLVSVSEFHTEAAVDFLVRLTPDGAAALHGARGRLTASMTAAAAAAGVDAGLASFFKLAAPIGTSNMYLFEPPLPRQPGGSAVCGASESAVQHYASPGAILAAFFPIRLALYGVRKDRTEALLAFEAARSSARARFISEVVTGRFVLGRRSVAEVTSQLWANGYPALPPIRKSGGFTEVTTDSVTIAHDGSAAVFGADEVLQNRNPLLTNLVDTAALRTPPLLLWAEGATNSSPPPSGGYEYLLRMPLASLTREAVARAEAVAAVAKEQLDVARRTPPADTWADELSALRLGLRDVDGYEDR